MVESRDEEHMLSPVAVGQPDKVLLAWSSLA